MMKGQILSLTRTTIIVVVILTFSVAALLFASQWNLEGMLSGSCGNNVCEPGETDLLCPNDCTEGEMGITAEHVVMLSDDSMTVSEVAEYINYPPSGEQEDCTSCTSCSECFDVQDYRVAENCNECDECDALIGNCSVCSVCSSARSDYYADNLRYDTCESCFGCDLCDIESDSLQSDDCGRCDHCSTCTIPETTTRVYDTCDYCSYKQTESGTYSGCSICYNSPFRIIDWVGFNLCKKCSSCGSCDDTEPILCQRVKECIANYLPNNPQPCVIDYHISASDADTTTDIYTDIINTLARCKNEPVYTDVSENGKQFMCNYDNIITVPLRINRNNLLFDAVGEEWQGDRDATYVQCGGTGYPFNRLYYNDWSIGTPEGINYRISIGDIGTGITIFDGPGWTYPADGNCRFNMFICAQPALITTTSINEMNDYTENPLTKIYSSILSMDEDTFEYLEEAPYQAVKSEVIEIDIGDKTAEINDIADAVVAATRDWVSISQSDSNTITKFYTIIEENGDTADFGETDIQKLKMNDKFFTGEISPAENENIYRTLDWKMVPINPSLRDDAYDDDELFYVYESQENLVTSKEHDYVVPTHPLPITKFQGTLMADSLSDAVSDFPVEDYLEWTRTSDCTDDSYIYANKAFSTESWETIKESYDSDTLTINHDSNDFSYKKSFDDLVNSADDDNLYGSYGMRITIINCDVVTSKIYYKYSLATKGDRKYIFYELNKDDTTNLNPTYTGKIKVQIAFYLESEKLRLENDPYLSTHFSAKTLPENYIDDTLVLTPMISIAQVD